MTPEEIETRFERIEAILFQTAEANRLLAEQNAARDRRMAEQNTAHNERTTDIEEQIQLLMISMNRLAESLVRQERLNEENERRRLEYEQYKQENDQRFNNLLEDVRAIVQEDRQWKQESDQRFNIVLEEVRSSNRRISTLENP